MIGCISEHSQSRWQTGLMLISTCLIRQSVFCMQMRRHFRFIINHKLSVTPFQTSQWCSTVIIEWLLPSAVDEYKRLWRSIYLNNSYVTPQWKKEVKVTHGNSAWVKVSEIKCTVISVSLWLCSMCFLGSGTGLFPLYPSCVLVLLTSLLSLHTFTASSSFALLCF